MYTLSHSPFDIVEGDHKSGESDSSLSGISGQEHQKD
jgi:hypothetical protein